MEAAAIATIAFIAVGTIALAAVSARRKASRGQHRVAETADAYLGEIIPEPHAGNRRTQPGPEPAAPRADEMGWRPGHNDPRQIAESAVQQENPGRGADVAPDVQLDDGIPGDNSPSVPTEERAEIEQRELVSGGKHELVPIIQPSPRLQAPGQIDEELTEPRPSPERQELPCGLGRHSPAAPDVLTTPVALQEITPATDTEPSTNETEAPELEAPATEAVAEEISVPEALAPGAPEAGASEPKTEAAGDLAREELPQEIPAPEPAVAEAPQAESSETQAEVAEAPATEVSSRRQTPAVHRDRRGSRRIRQPSRTPEAAPTEVPAPVIRAPADVLLRLMLHPIQKSVQLSLILVRPEGFPPSSMINIAGLVTIEAFDETRYDDVDIDWGCETLADELRFESPDGYRWIRSARRVQIFSSNPAEAGLVSVSAAALGREHAIVCRAEDADSVRQIAASAGSPPLITHEHWRGIPPGWRVLSDYTPRRAAEEITDATLSPLNPGYNIEITLVGGLPIRPRTFASGNPPRIETGILPAGVTVRIDGEEATLGSAGGWEAANWNAPGQHLIDIVPGPSLTYEIADDPADNGGWPLWDAHAGRFAGTQPWARARICGAAISGPSGETVLAHETRRTLIALGSRDDAAALQHRPDAEASVALVPAPPAFLIAASGLRRHQGEVIWLGLESSRRRTAGRLKASSFHWASIVRSAANRRLPLRSCGSPAAKETWRRAVQRARVLKRREP